MDTFHIQPSTLVFTDRNKPAARRATSRHIGPALFLVTLVGAGVSVFALFFGEKLRPRIPVETRPVLLLPISDQVGEEVSGAIKILSQASGWVEPDPYPVRVAALVDGFVEEVHALEGQAVREGELLATLEATNLRLELARREAEWRAAKAESDAAEREHQRMLADVRAAEARWAGAKDRAARARALTDANLAEAERVAARLAEEEATAMLEAARHALEAHLKTMEHLRANKERAEAELEQARVNLDRARIRSPMSGIVLRRHAAPGMKRMASMEDPDSATIVTLYDPRRLQVRAEVPLADAARVHVGMTARVYAAVFPNRPFTAVVTRITGEADIARNTLQVKLALKDPDERLRPEMLCRVEFFAREESSPAGAGGALWIPLAARQQNPDGTAFVWAVDPLSSRAERRPVVLDENSREGLLRVRDGLKAGERVVVKGFDRLRPGTRVTEVQGGRS